MVLGNRPMPGRPTIWFVGCYGFKGPLRQYFSLYRAVSQREGEREEKGQMRVKMSKQPPSAPTASAAGPCPTVIQIVGRLGTGSLPSTFAPPDPPPPTIWIRVGQGPTARAYCTCSRCGWGLFGHFYSHLSFLSSFSLSLGDGPI